MIAIPTRPTGRGTELNGTSIDHILADDRHAAVLLETTVTLGDRRQTRQYVDVHRLGDGKLANHWHLPLDHKAEAELFAGG